MVNILKYVSQFPVIFFLLISICGISPNLNINETTEETTPDFSEDHAISKSCSALLSEEMPWKYFRLPKYIIPIHYDLLIRLDLTNNSFSGEVNITINMTKETKYFLVNSKMLTVTNYEVYDLQTYVNIEVKETFYNYKFDYFILTMNQQMLPGNYVLRFEFYNSFQENYVWYKDENKGMKSYASTFFAPNYARNVFPCFDEPSFKATFSVKVMHEPNYTALSNAEVENITHLENGQILTEFGKTPPMSTYLLCIFISNFTFKETITENGIRLRAYASATTIDNTEFALNSADKVLTYFENSLGVPFPLKKLDLISLPYFDINGMENWGLITFLDTSFLTDNKTTVSQKLKTANLIAHELAHMWFGNLVTMEWFSDTWLNEGFATHFAWKGAKIVLPEYFEVNDAAIQELYSIMEIDKPLNHNFDNENISRLMTNNIFDDISYNGTVDSVQELYNIFEVDGTVKSPTIVREISDLSFGNVYDSIVYKKGSSILRMMEYFLGDDFLQGISKYLAKYSYLNVNTDVLWRELTAASKQKLDIKALMDPWVKQRNYPIVTIKSMEEENEDGQKQYEIFINPDSSCSMDDFPNQCIWNILLFYQTLGNSSINYMILNSTNSVFLSVTQYDLIKFNADFMGYYSVNYDLSSWKSFIDILETNHMVFSPSDRVNLLYDTFSLASSGILHYDIPLNLTRYLRKEEFHEALSLGLKYLYSLKELFSDNLHIRQLISKYIRSLGKHLYEKYGWVNKGSFLEKKLRVVLIEAVCGNNHQECLQTAVETFKIWMNGEEIESETSEHVYKYGLKEMSGEEPFNFMWNRYLNETNPLMKANFRNALSAVGNESLLARLLEYSMNETYINPTLRQSMLKSISYNRNGFTIVADYVSQWNELVEIFGINGAENIAHDVFIQQYQTKKDLNKVLKFYKNHPATKEGIQPRAKTLQMIRMRIIWHEKYKDQVTKWFQNNVEQDNHESDTLETFTH